MPYRRSLAGFLLCSVLVILPGAGFGATLSDPAVDSYNVRVGTQTFDGLYHFTTNTLLVETAEAIQGMGSDVIKLFLGSDYPRQYHYALPAGVTNLLTLARDEPSCRRVLDMPFRHIIAWAYSFSVPNAPFVSGYSAIDLTNDYRELYGLTRFLLTNYNNSGKTFYLGHWEGDGYFTPWTTNPSPTAIQGMIAWLNNRQKAIDDAKSASSFSNVNVFCYAEVNRVRDAMLNGATNNQRMINMVVPFVTNLDYVSYSSYDAMDLGAADLYATLDYIESKVPTNKLGLLPGERMWIGEYGWGGSESTAQQEPTTRGYIQRLLNYGRKAMPYLLFWEIYNNETNRLFCLIDSNNVKTASYDLHQRFINEARMSTARFKEQQGRLPGDAEFVSLVSPLLDEAIPAPVGLDVANLWATNVAASGPGAAASVVGQLTQGLYGDDEAAVCVFWGRSDGGTSMGSWEQSLMVGVNTNFNPAVFSVRLANLVSQTNYYYRFYATNATGEGWAPTSGRFSTEVVDPQAFGSRLKISFTGYNRGEALGSFPVLVRLGAGVRGFDYRQFASAAGADLRFTDAGGAAIIAHEIDEWNTNGVSTVWVQTPVLQGTNDYIWAYWGNPLATNWGGYAPGAVWSGDFALVWHLKEAGFPYADSTGQHPALSGSAPVSAAGIIGHGQVFDGATQYLDAGAMYLGNAFTLSAWVSLDPGRADIQSVWANKIGGWNSDGLALFVNSFQSNDGKLLLETGDGATGLTASTGANSVGASVWHHVAAAVNRAGGTAHLYVDGVEQTQSAAVMTDFANGAEVDLGRFSDGNFHYKGRMDEARIETGARSGNWIWASWMTVGSNGVFESYSAVARQAPSLDISSAAGALLLSWPASAVGYTLYTATNLLSPITWAAATNQPQLVSGQWQVSITPDPLGNRFFRLEFR